MRLRLGYASWKVWSLWGCTASLLVTLPEPATLILEDLESPSAWRCGAVRGKASKADSSHGEHLKLTASEELQTGFMDCPLHCEAGVSAHLCCKVFFHDLACQPKCYVTNSLVFGFGAAVYSFNRVSLNLGSLLNEMLANPCGVFYDVFPCVNLRACRRMQTLRRVDLWTCWVASLRRCGLRQTFFKASSRYWDAHWTLAL